MTNKLIYNRGDIYMATLPKSQQYSSVQYGYRPVLIVSSSVGNRTNDCVMICPLTTKDKQISVNVPISWSKDDRANFVLTNQIQTIAKTDIHNYVDTLSVDEIKKIERGLLQSLGMVHSFVQDELSQSEQYKQQKNDLTLLQQLLPQARDIMKQLKEITSHTYETKVPKKQKLTNEEVIDFIREWDDPNNNRTEVAEAYAFNSYQSAYSFRHGKRCQNVGID